MYSNKFVVSIASKGKTLTEKNNGVVPILFDSEYEIQLENKNSCRVVAKISIDGKNVSGSGLIIKAHGKTSLKRFVEDNRAFKFVAVSSKEKEQNQEKMLLGLIEVKFYKEVQRNHYLNTVFVEPYKQLPYPSPQIWCANNSAFKSFTGGSCAGAGAEFDAVAKSTFNTRSLDVGKTVMGSATEQRFTSEHIDIEDEFTTLRLQLQGYDEPQEMFYTLKESKVSNLEAENLRLKEEILRLENEKLREQLKAMIS